MPLPSVTILANKSTNDLACSNPAGDTNWMPFAAGDLITWRHSQQANNDAYSGTKYPVVKPSAGSLEAPRTFLVDVSENKYIQVPLAGTSAGVQNGGNTRYVFSAYVGGATAGIPYLECWNTNQHSLANTAFLGGGTPANSLIRCIATTNGAPGSATWSGTPMSGTDSRIALDSAALTEAKYLYWNAKMVVPSTFTPEQNLNCVMALRILYS